MAEEKNNSALKDAQYRKGLGIAFSNANNAAIELVKSDDRLKGFGIEEMMGRVKQIRNIILEDYNEFYSNVIAVVGSIPNFKPADTCARLQTAANRAELKKIWFSLSQDERQHPDVVACAEELKVKYAEA